MNYSIQRSVFLFGGPNGEAKDVVQNISLIARQWIGISQMEFLATRNNNWIKNEVDYQVGKTKEQIPMTSDDQVEEP